MVRSKSVSSVDFGSYARAAGLFFALNRRRRGYAVSISIPTFDGVAHRQVFGRALNADAQSRYRNSSRERWRPLPACVINQTNAGPAVARTRGAKEAKGRFLDPRNFAPSERSVQEL